MSVRLFTLVPALVLMAISGRASLAQDIPITVPTTTITILTTPYTGSRTGACSVFAAQSIMSNITQTLNIGSQSSGTGAGKVTFDPFTIAKNVDSCSATLFVQAASGTALKEVIAVVESRQKVNGALALYGQTFMIRLGLAAVSNLGDSAAAGVNLLEKVTFDFGDFTIAQFDAVSGKMSSCSGWDRVRNVQDSSNCAELETIALNRAKGEVR